MKKLGILIIIAGIALYLIMGLKVSGKAWSEAKSYRTNRNEILEEIMK